MALSFAACSFHSTAKHFNGRVGMNGEHVYVRSTTNVGFNFGIVLKLFGATDMDSMVDQMTASIAEEGGDHVRIIETSTENYWYGFPPFTWILTPVITTVSADYRPTTEAWQKDRADDLEAAKAAKK
ncbi:MAG TPA: hypothetical protein PKE00_12405 [Planctomycetota bacterium]|nr:hypothetical protein [Planctomycetota bacterium]